MADPSFSYSPRAGLVTKAFSATSARPERYPQAITVSSKACPMPLLRCILRT